MRRMTACSERILTFTATDGLILHGRLFSARNSRCIIHIHGLGSNFYSANYHEIMAERYRALGYDYFVSNNRGAEFIKKLRSEQKQTSEYYGYTFELFHEADRDIQGVIKFIRSLGYRSLILQGHSSGCQKILYTLSQHDISIESVVLLSPCDDVGLAIQQYGSDGLKEKVKFAQQTKEEFLPKNFFFDLPLSRLGFLSHYGPGNHFDIFHYYDPKRPFTEIAKNRAKTFVLFGERDHVIDFQVVKKVYGEYPQYVLGVLPSADHRYSDSEEALVNRICAFLRG